MEGASLYGVASADFSVEKQRFLEWLAAGKQADMAWLERQPERRMDPRLVLEGCRSVMVGAWPTGQHLGEIPEGSGRVAAYVGTVDYHKDIGEKLKRIAQKLSEQYPEEVFKTFVDTGPILERDWARLAGLGWIGKNTLLINPKEGSFFLLGVVLSTAEFLPTGIFEQNHCGHCTRCLDACPTQALDAQTGLDSNKCLSYWSIEHKGELGEQTPPPEEWQSWLYGCDICQAVCPFNRRVPEAPGPKDLNLLEVVEGEAQIPNYLRRGKKTARRNAEWLLGRKPGCPA